MLVVQEGSSLTLVHFKRYCHAPSDSPQSPVLLGCGGGCPYFYWTGQKMPCLSFLWPNTVLNARCSRRIFTYSHSFWTVLLCPFQYSTGTCATGSVEETALCPCWTKSEKFPSCPCPRYRSKRLSFRSVLHSHRSCSIEELCRYPVASAPRGHWEPAPVFEGLPLSLLDGGNIPLYIRYCLPRWHFINSRTFRNVYPCLCPSISTDACTCNRAATPLLEGWVQRSAALPKTAKR